MNFILLQVTQISNTGNIHKSAEELVKLDPYGLYLSVLAIFIVMVVLSGVFLVFKSISLLLQKRNMYKKHVGKTQNANVVQSIEAMPTGELSAAISMAMYLYNKDLHDNENTTLTIKRITHRYSPWSSKIYSMRNMS